MAKRSRRYTKKQNSGLLGALITLLILFIAVFGVVRGFEYHEASLQQAAIDASKSVKDKELREKEAFIGKVAPYAKQLYQTYHILPSITVAQAILESDWGRSRLASEFNNLFGVKSDDPENSRVLDTQEYVNGNWQTVKARFQVYNSYDASLLAHAKLLAGGTTWNQAQYTHVVNATDYKTAAQGLQQDGYATDPDYSKKIIQIIEKYQLTKYDP